MSMLPIMRMILAFIWFISILGRSIAINDNVFDELPSIPEGWTYVRHANADQLIHLRVALKQPNYSLFEQTLFEVSTPGDPKYGKHLKRNELKSILAPTAEASSAVTNWLEFSGARNVHDDGDWFHFFILVRDAERMLSSRFDVYHDAIRTLRYSVPKDIATHIEMIQPTTRFGGIRAHNLFNVHRAPATVSRNPAFNSPSFNLDITICNHTITPNCLRALYKIGDYKARPSNGSLFGVCGYDNQIAKHTDLETFLQKYASFAKDANFTSVSINGGLVTPTDKTQSAEAQCDIQYAASLAYQTPITFYSTGGLAPFVDEIDENATLGDSSNNEPFLDFLHYLVALPDDKLPQTLTTSYGEDEQSIPVAYGKSVCNLFGQLGARGVSVIFSAGDVGPGMSSSTKRPHPYLIPYQEVHAKQMMGK
jgi:tripeptidyl-peptidase-1